MVAAAASGVREEEGGREGTILWPSPLKAAMTSTPETLGIVGNPPNIQAAGLTAEDPFGVGIVAVDATAPIASTSNGQDSLALSYQPTAVGTPGTYDFPQLVVGGTYAQVVGVSQGSSISTIPDSQVTASNATGQTVASGSFQTVLYTGSGTPPYYTRIPGSPPVLTTGTGVFEAPQAGVYLMTSTGGFNWTGAAQTGAQLRLYDATLGAAIASQSAMSGNSGTSDDHALSIAATSYLAAGEQVYWQVYQNTGSSLTWQAQYSTWTLLCA